MAEIRIRIKLNRRGRTRPARNHTVSWRLDADRQRGANTTPERLITKRELGQMVPYTPQHILRLEKQGKFPRRIQVGANRVGWLLSEVHAWIAARVAERDASLR
jgi:prophage regulatory protein